MAATVADIRTDQHGIVMEPRIVGDRVVLRRATEDDLPALVAILEEPAVARWWQASSRAELEDLVVADSGDTMVFVAEVDGATAGLLYATEEPHPDYRHAGIDITLRTSSQGRGLGTDAVRTLARWLIEVRGHHRITIDPAASNAAAIASYRKVGFSPVGILRQYERGDDGRWHDGLLMDLLADELT